MTPPNQALQLIERSVRERSVRERFERERSVRERFERNLSEYKRPDYKEAHARAEFIDPLLQALGWDARNVHGRGEHDKDVIPEDAIRVGGKTLAPDYSFCVGNQVFPGSKAIGRVVQGGRRPGLVTVALFVQSLEIKGK